MKRISHEPAFVLHRYDWSESSLILEVLTRHQGRLALVAKGVKRPSSQFRAILLPLQLLFIAYSGDAQVRTLKGAEWQGGLTMPSGDALIAGYYLNELMMKLLARDDPHERLFDAYAKACQWLREPALLDASLRAFELVLLREIGVLPSLDIQTLSMQSLQDDARYSLLPEAGLRARVDSAQDQVALGGDVWRSLQGALNQQVAIEPARQAVMAMTQSDRASLKSLLRGLLNYHAGGRGFRTRQLMRDVQALA